MTPSSARPVMAAAGGVLIETLGDRPWACRPWTRRGPSKLIDRLDTRPPLDGVRSAPPADVIALARALSRLSLLVWDPGTSSAPSMSTWLSSVRADAWLSTP